MVGGIALKVSQTTLMMYATFLTRERREGAGLPKLIALKILGNKAAIFNIRGSFVEASLQQQATQQS